jgi:hypothetical protein
VRNILIGLAVAVALALIAADASIAGIAAWKVILAVIGLIIFVGGRERRGPV